MYLIELPQDVVFKIGCLLDLESVSSFAKTCWHLHSLIASDNYWTRRLEYDYSNPDFDVFKEFDEDSRNKHVRCYWNDFTNLVKWLEVHKSLPLAELGNNLLQDSRHRVDVDRRAIPLLVRSAFKIIKGNELSVLTENVDEMIKNVDTMLKTEPDILSYYTLRRVDIELVKSQGGVPEEEAKRLLVQEEGDVIEAIMNIDEKPKDIKNYRIINPVDSKNKNIRIRYPSKGKKLKEYSFIGGMSFDNENCYADTAVEFISWTNPSPFLEEGEDDVALGVQRRIMDSVTSIS